MSELAGDMKAASAATEATPTNVRVIINLGDYRPPVSAEVIEHE